MKNFLKRSGGEPESRPKTRDELIEQLHYGKPPPIRKYAVRPPEDADENLKGFYRDTEWLQPVLNRFVGSEGMRFNEEDTPYVSLSTYDGPDHGRTFNLSFGSVAIGEVAVVPNNFRLSDETDWADLRIRLTYPVELLDGETVHGLLTSLIRLTQEFEDDTFEGVRDDPRASTLASKAIVESLWDRMRQPSDATIITLNVAGPWTKFKNYVLHWKNAGIDPWETWERKRDD